MGEAPRNLKTCTGAVPRRGVPAASQRLRRRLAPGAEGRDVADRRKYGGSAPFSDGNGIPTNPGIVRRAAEDLEAVGAELREACGIEVAGGQSRATEPVTERDHGQTNQPVRHLRGRDDGIRFVVAVVRQRDAVRAQQELSRLGNAVGVDVEIAARASSQRQHGVAGSVRATRSQSTNDVDWGLGS
jgi:hypothetical protein